MLRAPQWGLNVAIGLTPVAAVAIACHCVAGNGTARSAGRWWVWIASAFFPSKWVLRDAELLLAVNLLAALSLACLPLLEPRTAALRAAGVLEIIAAALRTAGHAVTGAAEPIRSLRPLGFADPAGTRRARAVSVGLVPAIPAVLLFGSLLASADPIFAAVIQSLIGIDLGPLLSHAALTAVLAWLGAGYLWAQAIPRAGKPLLGPRAHIDEVEVSTMLGATAFVFIAFVAVQAGSLFGGEAFVQKQAGLTYAQYARRGFFQMVSAAALSMPLVYVAPFAAERARPTQAPGACWHS